jgi:hypothetical protein
MAPVLLASSTLAQRPRRSTQAPVRRRSSRSRHRAAAAAAALAPLAASACRKGGGRCRHCTVRLPPAVVAAAQAPVVWGAAAAPALAVRRRALAAAYAGMLRQRVSAPLRCQSLRSNSCGLLAHTCICMHVNTRTFGVVIGQACVAQSYAIVHSLYSPHTSSNTDRLLASGSQAHISCAIWMSEHGSWPRQVMQCVYVRSLLFYTCLCWAAMCCSCRQPARLHAHAIAPLNSIKVPMGYSIIVAVKPVSLRDSSMRQSAS